MNQTEVIKSKLELLQNHPQNNKIFGSHSHKFALNPILSIEKIQEFEEKYQIELPEGYRNFILTIGDGGAGPFYGIVKLSDSIYSDMDYLEKSEKLTPSKPFPHKDHWNFDFDKDEVNWDEYFDIKYVNGVIRLCNYGCGVFINLVVNGSEHGFMWTDDRGNDGGIYPSMELDNKEKLKFLDWYELWLDKSLEELNKIE